MVEINRVGYKCKATKISKSEIVSDEKIKARMYCFLDTSLGTLATAKKEITGTAK